MTRDTHTGGIRLDALPWCVLVLEELRLHSAGTTLTTLQAKACTCGRASLEDDFLGSMPESILGSGLSDGHSAGPYGPRLEARGTSELLID